MKNRTLFSKFLVGTLALVAATGIAQAQIASDDASQPAYNPTWESGDNGGTGFGAWGTVTQGFIGSSTANGNGSSGGIDTSGKSFALYSNSDAPALGEAIRPFGSSLAVGNTLTLGFDSGYIGTGGSQGISLLSGANIRFEFYFSGGGSSYTVAGASNQSTTQGFSTDGMYLSLTLTSTDTFAFTVAFNGGTPEVFTGTLGSTPGSAIDSLRFFNYNPNQAGGDDSSTAYFNSPTVVPEPSSLALIAGPVLLGAWFFLRRRRA